MGKKTKKKTNVIQFPKPHIRPERLSEEVAQRNIKGKEIYLENAVTTWAEGALVGFEAFGLDLESEDFERGYAYLTLVARAIFCADMNTKHDLHEVFKSAIKEVQPDGNSYSFPDVSRETTVNTKIEVKTGEKANTANSLVS